MYLYIHHLLSSFLFAVLELQQYFTPFSDSCWSTFSFSCPLLSLYAECFSSCIPHVFLKVLLKFYGLFFMCLYFTVVLVYLRSIILSVSNKNLLGSFKLMFEDIVVEESMNFIKTTDFRSFQWKRGKES